MTEPKSCQAFSYMRVAVSGTVLFQTGNRDPSRNHITRVAGRVYPALCCVFVPVNPGSAFVSH